MTNEQLVRQYYDGDDAALEKLYHKNIGLIRGIAKEAAAEFNCLIMEQHHPNQCSAYTKTILDDLCGEGAVELLTRIQSREYVLRKVTSYFLKSQSTLTVSTLWTYHINKISPLQ